MYATWSDVSNPLLLVWNHCLRREASFKYDSLVSRLRKTMGLKHFYKPPAIKRSHTSLKTSRANAPVFNHLRNFWLYLNKAGVGMIFMLKYRFSQVLAIKWWYFSNNTVHVEEYFMSYSPWGSCLSIQPLASVFNHLTLMIMLLLNLLAFLFKSLVLIINKYIRPIPTFISMLLTILTLLILLWNQSIPKSIIL